MRNAIGLKMMAGIALATALSVRCAEASIIYGSLSNFDCINDTGSTAHGFEIELEGIDPSEVWGTFGAPYNRYGEPTITTDGVKTYIRHTSTYDSINGIWAVGTESGSYAPTDGHSLYYPQYGGSLNYPNVPGDHFGVALSANPTNTAYYWLLDGGGGTLVRAGSQVRVPAPVFNVVAPANPANPAGVQAVIQAPDPVGGQEFGDALWAKVFTTEVEAADPVELEDLVLGNPIVPPETETEIEWYLLQQEFGKPDSGEFADVRDVVDGKKSVTRRFEFYEYLGGYDQETHEALTDIYVPEIVGDFLGNQNAAANFAFGPAAVPEPGTLLLAGVGACGLFFAHRRRMPSVAGKK